MFLKKLKLVNYRNYLDFEGKFDHLKTIIIGQNAQGKTNILEAINILATAHSNRAERDNDLVYWNKEHALIFATVQTQNSNLEIALQINTTGRRKLKINDVPKKAPQADLLGNFFAVMFSCEDMYLIKGSPSIRRNWIDSVLFQLDSKYHRLTQDYQKSTTQKNSLLKQSFESGLSRKALKEQVEIWNNQIINSGSEILATRLKFLEDIRPITRDFQKNISKQNENLDLIYKSTVQLPDCVIARSFSDEAISQKQYRSNEIASPSVRNDKETLKSRFKKALDESFEAELARGQSLIGPHRDDLLFLINDKEAKSFASQGQQRSIVLALKLAELKIIEKRRGEIPVLLLDDVFAELDESRQDFLLHNLPKDIQTFLTTTHLSGIQKEFLRGAQILEIRNGQLVESAECGV